MVRRSGRNLLSVLAIAVVAAVVTGFASGAALAQESDADRDDGISIFGIRLTGGDDAKETKKAPEPTQERAEDEDDDGISIFGLRLSGGGDDEKEAEEAAPLEEDARSDDGVSILGVRLSGGDEKDKAVPITQPANTIIMTVGLGYDSFSDKTPAKTREVVFELLPKTAPNHAKRIKALTRNGYYNGKTFHRVVEGFMAQAGSPNGDGVGGAPGFPDLKAEFSKIKFRRGIVAMARTNLSNDTANAQFFIMYGRDFGLDGKYTVIGKVLSGMDALEKLSRTASYTAQGEAPILGVVPDRIVRMRVASDAQR